MFGKLLKYEFKSTAKWYLLITPDRTRFVSDYRCYWWKCYKRFCEYGNQ